MKKVWLFMLLVLGTGCFLLMANIRGATDGFRLQPGIAEEVIRFHVRANSEDPRDQEMKMQVRDTVVAYLQPLLETAKNKTHAKKLLSSRLEEICQVAERTLEKAGSTYGAAVSFGKEHFPRKTYGDCTLPAGNYLAVVIELGDGNGHNWWCMLYPGLCFVDETCQIVSEEKKEDLQHILTEEEYHWMTDPANRKITFRWEWIRDIMSKLMN